MQMAGLPWYTLTIGWRPSVYRRRLRTPFAHQTPLHGCVPGLLHLIRAVLEIQVLGTLVLLGSSHTTHYICMYSTPCVHPVLPLYTPARRIHRNCKSRDHVRLRISRI